MPSLRREARRMRWVLWILAAGGLAAAPLACGTADNPPNLTGTGSGVDADLTPSCDTPAAGCSCASEGQQAACGEEVVRSGNYVTCSEGTRTCTAGVWGACVGAFVTTKSVAASGAIHALSLNPSMSCVAMPCDPSCMAFVDDPSGLDAGLDSGLAINDSGVSLTGVPLPPAQCTSLQVTPTTSPGKDLVVTNMAPSPNTVQFTASLLPAGCYPGTPTFLWSVDKYDLVQVSSGGLMTLASPIAGPITINAYAGKLSATVVSNVTVNVVDTTTGPAPTGYSNTQFPTTTGLTDNISILYPYPATVFPLGLPSPLIQWQNNNSPATTASAVKVTLRFPATNPIFSWSEIVPELQTAPTGVSPGAPRATIPLAVWTDFQQTVVRNSGATGGDAVFAIQRYVGGKLYGEVPTTIHFANGQLKGNIYYNSYGTNLVKNFGSTPKGASFGAATLAVPVNGTSPTVVVGYTDATLSGAGCRVCHNASAGGTRLLSNSFLSNGSTGGGSEATTWTYNPTLGTPAAIQGSETLIGSTYGSNKFTYAALSPDGSYLMTSAAPASAGAAAALFTAGGAAITSNAPTSLGAATPAFADDASAVAFTYYNGNAKPLSNVASDGKSLAMMTFAPPGTFSNFRVLSTPASGYSAWPSFLPPGQNGIVYQNEITANGRDWAGTRSTCDSSGSCNGIGATSELWWVSTGATPIATRLANMNGGSYMPRLASTLHGAVTDNPTYYEEIYNYEPTALPVTIGGYSWVAFTSRRLYGNVATINPYWSDPRFQDISVQPTTKKIWIAAMSPNPTPGTDPSFPAFYLPGQELLAGNSRAYFALAGCEAAGLPTAANLCTSNLDCCGATSSPATAVCQLDPPPLANPPTSHCVATSSASCVADGAVCANDAQCCNFGTGSRCASGVCAPTPPIVTYSTAPFVVNFTATCASGLAPSWNFFTWQSKTPTGTSITFTAATSPDGVSWGAPVSIGTAAPPPTATTTWTAGPQTVQQALKASSQTSQAQLMVTATLNPDSTKTLTPVLTAWQLQYDCVAAE